MPSEKKYLDESGLAHYDDTVSDRINALVTGVSGVKGNAETDYRTGNVNITPANIGAAPATGSTEYVAKSGDTVTGRLKMKQDPLWVQGGSDVGGNTNRLTTSSGMPGDMQYGSGKRGSQIYSNGIAMCDPYNGGSANDSAWIRHIEETANSGFLEIAVGDDGDEQILARQYNTSNGIAREAKLLDASGNTKFPGILSLGGSATIMNDNVSHTVIGAEFGYDPAAYGHDTARYFQYWIKYMIKYRSDKFLNRMTVSPAWPNSQGTAIGWCYSGSDSNYTPDYATFLYIPLSGAPIYFGYSNYNWYFQQLGNKHSVIYNNGATNGTVYMNDYAYNYNHMRIYYCVNDHSACASVDIVSPNGQAALLGAVQPRSSVTVYAKTRRVYIADSTISTHIPSGWAGSGEAGIDNGGGTRVSDNNTIYIVRVEAWNE